MDSMYETILSLPLFSGVSYNKISEIVGGTKFHFLKYSPGNDIATAGEQCTHVKFLISGKVRMTIENADQRFRITQTIIAPDVLAPDFLFGRATVYPGTITAIDNVGILQIEKNDYIEILHSDPVFLYNFLNMLSRSAQKSVDGVLAVTTGSLEQRVAFWIVALTQPGSTDIRLECRHRDLYSLFGVQRSIFMSTLNSMKERGILDYATNRIDVLSRPALVDLLLQ